MIVISMIKASLKNMRNRKLRAGLTVLSVFIGVCAIFLLISFGQGLLGFVEEMSQKMGDDKLIVRPKGFGMGPANVDSKVVFSNDEVDVVSDVLGVKEAVGIYYTTAPVKFNDVTKYVFVMGNDFKNHRELIGEIYTLGIYSGRELSGKEKKDVILGNGYIRKDSPFEREMIVGERILINDIKFRVVGFYEEVGNPIDDFNVYLSDKGYEELFGDKNFQTIFIRSSAGKDPSNLIEKIKEELRDERGQKKGGEDFFVETFEQVIASFTSIFSILNIVLVLIAFVSLVVAGVNIANTMYTSVLERTKDIGVMKSIGAKNKDILTLFVFESGFLSFVGGLLGVFVGSFLALFAGELVANAGYGILRPALSLKLYVGCLTFSLFIGLVSGILPAYRASKMNPVDALRYE